MKFFYVFSVCTCRTLTAPIELIKCLKSIKEHAFVASEYPVILTLEDHLTPDLQDKVAQVSHIFFFFFFGFIFVILSH